MPIWNKFFRHFHSPPFQIKDISKEILNSSRKIFFLQFSFYQIIRNDIVRPALNIIFRNEWEKCIRKDINSNIWQLYSNCISAVGSSKKVSSSTIDFNSSSWKNLLLMRSFYPIISRIANRPDLLIAQRRKENEEGKWRKKM